MANIPMSQQATNPLGSYGSDYSAVDALAVTPSDTVNFGTNITCRGLYIGTTGNVAVVLVSGNVVTFTGVPAGTILPVVCTRVNNTNTTASNIIGLI